MDKQQEINCTVASCKFHDKECNKCILESIQVAPIEETYTEEPDESMCASYEFDEE